MSTIQRIGILGFCCLLAIPCVAQDPIFGDAGGLFTEPPVEEATADPEATDDDAPDNRLPANSLLVRQLLGYAQRGHVEMADAISSLARIGRWSEVDRLLSQVPGKNYGPQAKAEMSDRIGPALFLRMKRSEELSEAASASLDQLAAAAVSLAESPELLRRAITQMGSDSIDNRLAAARRLLGGGNVAIAELAAAAVSEKPPVSRDEILRIMLELGDGGVRALRQLALYGTADVRVRALQSLSRISGRAHLADLLTAAHAADSSETEKAVAAAKLQQMRGELPGRAAAIDFLISDFEDKRNDARLVDNDQQPVTLWTVSADGSGVTFQSTPQIFAAYRDVVDAGTRLRRIGGLDPDRNSEILAADLTYRLLIDPDWGDPEQVEMIRNVYGSSAGVGAISNAIRRTLRSADHVATIGLIRLIDVVNASVMDRNLLLRGDGLSAAPLVEAVSSPEPQVRYEAALAAAQLAQGARYFGSSRVKHSLGEMSTLDEKPTAILLETRGELLIQLETILADLGYNVEVVSSVRELQRVVARGGDLRLIVAKTELPDSSAIEMIDLVRRLERGRQLPIVFYGSEPPGLGPRRWQAPTVLMDRPASSAAFDGLMDRVRRKRRLPYLTEIDRQRFRQAASDLLQGSETNSPR